MGTIGLILGITCVSSAALFVVLSVALLQGNVKMNRWYGFRIKKAFSSEENWYKINRYGARRVMLWSAPLFLAGVVALCLPFGSADHVNLPLVLAFASAPLVVLIPVIETCLHARKL